MVGAALVVGANGMLVLRGFLKSQAKVRLEKISYQRKLLAQLKSLGQRLWWLDGC